MDYLVDTSWILVGEAEFSHEICELLLIDLSVLIFIIRGESVGEFLQFGHGIVAVLFMIYITEIYLSSK